MLGNIDAMAWGLDAVEPGGSITLDTMLEAHGGLLTGTHLQDHAARIRTVQNWIGGSNYNPCAAPTSCRLLPRP